MSNFRHNPILTFLVHMTQSVLLRQVAYPRVISLSRRYSAIRWPGLIR